MSSCAVPVVLPSIPQVLSDQEEVWLEGSPAGPPGTVRPIKVLQVAGQCTSVQSSAVLHGSPVLITYSSNNKKKILYNKPT